MITKHTQLFTDKAHKIITDECASAVAPKMKKVEIYTEEISELKKINIL